MIALGVVILTYALNMNISVYRDVVNIDLLYRRQNTIILGGIVFVSGIILFALARIRSASEGVQPTFSIQNRSLLNTIRDWLGHVEINRANSMANIFRWQNIKVTLKWTAIIFLIAFVGLIVRVIIVDLSKSPEEKAARLAEIAAYEQEVKKYAELEIASLPVIAVDTISSNYVDNISEANHQYKDTKIKVTGFVSDIVLNAASRPYITLRGKEDGLEEPQFGFEKSDTAQLAALAVLEKGTEVTLVCIGRGSIWTLPIFGSCKLLNSNKPSDKSQN